MIKPFLILGIAVLLAGLLCAVPVCAATIKVLTYNIHHGEGTDGKIDIERIAGLIRAESPDVVCLQEVDRNMSRTNGLDIPALLAAKLGMNVTFGPNLEIQGGHYGNATLTPHEILKQENCSLPTPEDGEPRGCLRTTIAVGNQTVDVFNTHFSIIGEERIAQASRVFDVLPQHSVVLAGDLNETDTAEGLELLLRHLQDTAAAMRGERRTTIGEGEKARRIDYVLVSRDLRVVSARVIDTKTSR
ncbi:MAG: endonuclease/exonuclease/phosphatase family protein, partial [Candidatus Hydrogenedentes bacterium]|nr:endonuclease/exonuclease/phosphatase family protein [Candidatus Hydrogenedentota bacterium]